MTLRSCARLVVALALPLIAVSMAVVLTATTFTKPVVPANLPASVTMVLAAVLMVVARGGRVVDGRADSGGRAVLAAVCSLKAVARVRWLLAIVLLFCTTLPTSVRIVVLRLETPVSSVWIVPDVVRILAWRVSISACSAAYAVDPYSSANMLVRRAFRSRSAGS